MIDKDSVIKAQEAEILRLQLHIQESLRQFKKLGGEFWELYEKESRKYYLGKARAYNMAHEILKYDESEDSEDD